MASRFWVTQPVSGAVVSVASPPQVRLTVSSTTGMTTGDVRTVFGVVGTTEANGTWTITVIDGTHIDLQGTTFANLYTSGGSVNGKWDGTNTNNWVTTSAGTNYGQTVPGSADDVTLDASSGGGTVTVNTNFSVRTLTMSAFTGTLDLATNNNSPTIGVNGFVNTGAGVRTLNMGSGTWTLTTTTSGTMWSQAGATNLTFNCNTSTIKLTGGGTAARTIALGAFTYNTITLDGFTASQPSNVSTTLTIATTTTIATLNVTGPNFVEFTGGQTIAITNAWNVTGTSSAPIAIKSSASNSVVTISSANNGTFSWCAFRGATFTGGGTFTATNSFDLLDNTGITISPPSAGAVGVIGG